MNDSADSASSYKRSTAGVAPRRKMRRQVSIPAAKAAKR